MNHHKGTLEEESPPAPIVPFLKWPGGKRWVASRIAEIARPLLTGTYYEPFLGGGAVFFQLRPKVAVLSDINAELIATYRAVRDQPSELVALIRSARVNAKEYKRQRDSKPEGQLHSAARFLYLNRTAFGGMYRLNAQGDFNVPFGGGERTPAPLWTRNLLAAASPALKAARLVHSDFETQLRKASKGDVCYCDPTYTVAHNNNGFVRYNERNFSWEDQQRLAEAVQLAANRGATVLVSNADHPSIVRLYRGARRLRLERRSTISARVGGRRSVTELLIVVKAR